ncbi:MAG TPA: lytic transglycosylase domain-containing protein [Gemmatimonadaceae bacterium]|nr:lytic transglycosylase domain-containing protein [Gemmatimonadaceae bacterium]
MVISVTAVVIAGIVIAAIFFARDSEEQREEARIAARPEAPPDLEKLRDEYTAGVDAVRHKDGPAAVTHLSSFTFGPRAVEEYRLYYLAQGHHLAGNEAGARYTLARLWSRQPHLVHRTEAGFNLASLHATAGDSSGAADVAAGVAVGAENYEAAAIARWGELHQRFAAGDIAGAIRTARRIVVASPRSAEAGEAAALLRAVWSIAPEAPLILTSGERVERGVSFMRDGDPRNAYDELTALEPYAPASLKEPIALNRGLALYQMRKFEDAIRVFEPLTSRAYKLAIPALYHLSKSYRVLANSIDPTVNKTITEKKQSGTVKVRVGKGKKARTVTKPKIVTTKRNVKLVDLAKKTKKDNYDRLANERLKDLLQLPLSKPVRLEVLNTLLAMAEAKNQDEYEQELIRDIIKLDPASDPGLQHFWDKAWAAYMRGDLASAKSLLGFINESYSNPNVKRQSSYWLARVMERAGQKEEATAIYTRLAAAPYLDVYAAHSVARGAKHEGAKENPLLKEGPDWREMAEKDMPEELRLAYELTALTDFGDARVEIQKHLTPFNDRFAQALLAEIYYTSGAVVLMQRAVKRAFPQIATVEQDTAPVHFLKMYYPVKYGSAIKKYADKNGIDPYLVMGLILQESSYMPTAKSAVGATGLMQLMPATAKELAQRLHVPFGQSRLENPEVNIELGTAHLKMLINMFSGNTTLAVASYNAGQGNVLKWKRGAPSRPIDEFIESIPFPETRNYVKRVTMLRASYARIAQ